MKFLTKNFFRGILVLTPTALTLYILYTIFHTVDRLGDKLFGRWISEGPLLTGIGFFLTLFLIVVTGYVSSVWIGSAFFDWIEKQFIRSPFVKGIYVTIRD